MLCSLQFGNISNIPRCIPSNINEFIGKILCWIVNRPQFNIFSFFFRFSIFSNVIYTILVCRKSIVSVCCCCCWSICFTGPTTYIQTQWLFVCYFFSELFRSIAHCIHSYTCTHTAINYLIQWEYTQTHGFYLHRIGWCCRQNRRHLFLFIIYGRRIEYIYHRSYTQYSSKTTHGMHYLICINLILFYPIRNSDSEINNTHIYYIHPNGGQWHDTYRWRFFSIEQIIKLHCFSLFFLLFSFWFQHTLCNYR